MPYAISGDVATLLGESPTNPTTTVALTVQASQPVIMVDDTGRMGGQVRVPLADDGTFTVAGLPETTGGVGPLYRMILDARSLRIAGQTPVVTGWFSLTADRDLTWIVNNYVETTLVTAQVAANIAAAAALGTTNDTATASFINNSGSATRAALNAQYLTPANLATHTNNTNNPHATTKAQVGLGNVDNTADTAKPVSTAQQTALNLKANLASPTFTGDPKAPTATVTDDDTTLATTAFVKLASSPLIAQSMELRENFTNMADGAAPAVTETRQSVTNYGPATTAAVPYVRSGFLSTTTPNSAEGGSYRIAQLSGPVVHVGGRFAFTSYTVDGGLMCFSIQQTSISTGSPVPVSPMHFWISPTGWSLDVNDTAGTAVEGVTSGTFTTPLVADGTTLHTVDIVLDRDRGACYVTFPNGFVLEARDSRFSLPGTFVYAEPFKSAGSLSGKTNALLKEWWADSRGIEALAAVRPLGTTIPVQPTLTASWTNVSARPVKYWRQGGRVRIRGAMTGGTVGSTFFTLPAASGTDRGYRPPFDMHLPIVANAAFADLLVLANGSVIVATGSNTDVNINVEFDLNGWGVGLI